MTSTTPREALQHIGWLKMYAESMDETNWRDMKDRITRQLAQLSASVTPPEGYVLVPREPTRAMIDAGDAVDRPAAPYSGYAEERASAEDHYRAMISASPVAGKGQ